MSDTPRTDAAATTYLGGNGYHDMVEGEFARTLERELAEKDATIAERAQEIERLKEQSFDLEDRLIQVRTARETAERERDEALELVQREVAKANKTTTAALLMGAQTNEALKEARKALVWLEKDRPNYVMPEWVETAVRAAGGAKE